MRLKWRMICRIVAASALAALVLRPPATAEGTACSSSQKQAPRQEQHHIARPRAIPPAVLLYTVRTPRAWDHCRIYASRGGGRVLVYANALDTEFFWLSHRRLTPTRIAGWWHTGGDLAPFGVDFWRGWIYRDPDEGMPGGGLMRVSFDGRHSCVLETSEVIPAQVVIPGKAGDTVFEIGFAGDDAVSDLLRIYVGGKLAREVPIAHNTDGAVYAWRAGVLYLVNGSRVEQFPAGSRFWLPGTTHDGQWSISTLMDVTPDGAYLYYANPATRVIYKIIVSTGRVISQRRIGFAPAALALQGARHRLIVAAWTDDQQIVDAIDVFRCF